VTTTTGGRKGKQDNGDNKGEKDNKRREITNC